MVRPAPAYCAPMHATLLDLKFFVAAYEERSFTAAAERVHATQSGVSQHVRQLEDQLGVPLFLRDKGKVRPTPAGDRYYRHAVEVLRACDTAALSVQDLSGGLQGEVNVGLMPAMTRCVLAPALAGFVEQHPNVVLQVVEGFSGLLTEMVAAQKLDFAIVPAFTETPGLRQRRVHQAEEVLVRAAGPGRRSLQPLRLATLPPLKVVLPSGRNTRRHLLEAYFRSNGVAVDRVIELDTMHGVLDFVARTDWCTVLPSVMLMQPADRQAYCLNPLADPPMATDFVLIESASRALPAAAKAFAQVLQAEMAGLDAAWRADVSGR
jgi:LysR family transcriptional regulator, nitrogen assimilation regulatory protein